MALREQLERLVDDMVTKGVRYDEAQREFEKKFITHVLAKADGNLGKAATCWAFTAIPLTARSPNTGCARVRLTAGA